MAKKDISQHKQQSSKHVTKRRLARWEREKRRQRITLFSGVAVIVLVIAIIVGGAVASNASDWLSRVQTDSGTVTIKKADYADELKLYAAGVYNSSSLTDESPLIMIENSLLIEGGADEAGLSVPESEVTDTIRSMFETENESVSDSDFQEKYQRMLDNMGLSDADFREVITHQLLNEKLLQYYLDQVPESGQQAAVESIVFYNESEAEGVAQSWREGEAFETLSLIYSDYSNSGWVAVGALDDALSEAVSTITIGNVSDPIAVGDTDDETATIYYYVVKVLERKDDVLDDSLREEWGYSDYTTWYYEAYAEKVERNPDVDLAEVYEWAIEQLQ